MNPEHVVAIVAAILQVRNQIAITAARSCDKEALAAALGDPIQEARELLSAVINDAPELPEAPHTRGAGITSEPVKAGA